MSGFFTIGEQKIRPGTYMRYDNTGLPTEGIIPAGVSAAVFKANWGPLAQAVDVTTDGDIEKYYGADDDTTNLCGIITEQRKAAKTVKSIRLGAGGTKATYAIKDTTGSPITVINATAKYVGTRALSLSIKDSIADATKRELIIYEGTKELQKVTFAKGVAEVDGLIAALAAVGSDWVDLAKVAAGTGTLAVITQVAMTGGVNPVVTSADYSNAFGVLEPLNWDCISMDTNDSAINTLLVAYLNRIFNDGKLVRGVVGEATSVAFATRKTNCAAFNSFLIQYVLNGYKEGTVAIEGFRAAARLAGLIAAGPGNKSYTHEIITGATDLTEVLTGPQIDQAIQSGAIVFTTNALGQIQIEYGINTLITLSATQDAGWKKIRRVSTRFELMKRINAITDPLVGKVDNDDNGRATIIASSQGVINSMIKEGKLLPGGLIYIDPDNSPAGDSAWFKIAVDDLDSAEKIYFAYNFRFAPQ